MVARLRLLRVVDLRPPGSPLLRVANGVRSLVLRGNDALPEHHRGLVRGLLVGDTRGIPEATHDDFRRTGLGHLLAVSGSNVAFVLAVVAPVGRRLGLRGRLVVGVAAVVVFAAVTRFEPSVLRASVTAGLAMVASYLGRPTAGLRILALAVAALLLADPLLAHSLAFRLSVAASLGILLLAPRLRERLPGPGWMREVSATTIAAQTGVAPVIVPVFGSMPLAALPANVAAVPLAGPITVWGMAAGALGGAVAGWLPELRGLLQVPTAAMTHGLLAVASLGSRVPGEVDGRAAWALVAAGSAVGAVVTAQRGHRRPEAVP